MSKVEKIGIVVSKKTPKTLIVKVKRFVKHPIYKKRFSVTKRFAVHDPEEKFQEGDTVLIREIRPISKTKRFIVIEKVEA